MVGFRRIPERSYCRRHGPSRRATLVLATTQGQTFAGLLTGYTAKRARISSSLACQYSQVYLQSTPPDVPELAAASYISIHRSTYVLYHQTRWNQQPLYMPVIKGPLTLYITKRARNQQQPRMLVFAGLLTRYTTEHARINSSTLTCQYSQVYLRATPPNVPKSVAASHTSIRRSTYSLHHQSCQNQQQPLMLVLSRSTHNLDHQTCQNQ
ncbi:uncharacterized protein CC84DRAFT_566707 [Paraphaeosphaeria sporulosa]|uniref:Uncharacterized protein n=1 Tax=Paraphaeosphaeria sporulosa TaxID=1460663 RepID=A0A177CLV4_9PLEO|nr:uncharacterized protein CC84DRAFT_566707 [Paraphaeosphaeria sporulosa]OAG08286.1 hypothetical protein CC84DRAFT_566707 [Paraphaeosphaeria sporulosa]